MMTHFAIKMTPVKTRFSTPDTLAAVLASQIDSAGGFLSFDAFMQAALYHPQYGYYTTQPEIIGARGDFVTAPELSAQFSVCLAKFCQQQLHAMEQPAVLEFGAGNGVMAAGILAELAPGSYTHYYIVEVSPQLMHKQRETISQRCPSQLDGVVWLTAPPDDFTGVILANEVLDAMPVKRFQLSAQQCLELGVTMTDDALTWATRPAEGDLLQRLEALISHYQIPTDYYQSELSLAIDAWLQALTPRIKQAVMLIIDYGFSGAEFYHPSRNQGTLMCHSQQRAHPDPLFRPGTQDITAHVDFSQLADQAEALSWCVEEFTTQAYFLLAQGILDLFSEADWAAKQALKQLTLPHEMGELFKAMIITKNFDYDSSSAWPSLLNRL
jgi:SAM-dependent MidA family methyltransferase